MDIGFALLNGSMAVSLWLLCLGFYLILPDSMAVFDFDLIPLKASLDFLNFIC